MSFRSKLTMQAFVNDKASRQLKVTPEEPKKTPTSTPTILISIEESSLSQANGVNMSTKAIKQQKVPVSEPKETSSTTTTIGEKGSSLASGIKMTRVTGQLPKDTLTGNKKKTTAVGLKPLTTEENSLSQVGNVKVTGSSQSTQKMKNVSPSFGPFQPSKSNLQTKMSMSSPQVSATTSTNKIIVNVKISAHNIRIPIEKNIGTRIGTSPTLQPFTLTTKNVSLSPSINTQENAMAKNSEHGLPKLPTTSFPLKVPNNSMIECPPRPPNVDKLPEPSSGQDNTNKRVNNNQIRHPNLSGPHSRCSYEELEHQEHIDVTEIGENEASNGTKKRTYCETTGKVTWCDNIEVDPDEMVEVEEIQEDGQPKLGTMEGTILSRHIWLLPHGRKIKVHFNEFDQPIRKGGLVLTHFLTDIAKDGCYCPIGEVSWRQLDDHYKLNIVKVVREKFVLPDRIEIGDRILLYVNSKWKHYRWELYRDYYQPNGTK